jgi:hypothetical protein
MNSRANLENLVQAKKLTQHGKEFLLTALDPFHDWKFTPSGYPDSTGGNSIVCSLTSTTNISAPASAAGGNWDCLITNMGFDGRSTEGPMATNTFTSDGIVQHVDHLSTVGAMDHYPLTIVSQAAGVDCYPNPGTGAVTGLYSKSYFDEGRAIGMAFEVHNTTAEIYKQGTVVTGLLPEITSQAPTVIIDDNIVPQETLHTMRTVHTPPPFSPAAATLPPNSATWEASKGCYCICRMSGYDNDVDRVHRTYHSYVGTSVMSNSQGSSTSGYPSPDAAQNNKFDRSYAYFSGLSNETTLTVTFKTFFEYFPDATYPLLTQSTPSPPLDPVALQLYSQLVNLLPVAVPVGMNPKGEYFGMILKTIGTLAQSLAPELLRVHPMLGAAGLGLGTVASAVGDSLVSRAELNRRNLQSRKDKQQAMQQTRKKKKKSQTFGKPTLQ